MANSAGRVRIMPRGAYDASMLYDVYDGVTYNGNIYVCIRSAQGITPSADSDRWAIWLDTGDVIADAIASSTKMAADSAAEAESWAVGGTGTRTGEDTDNSKYYSEQSQGYMETAKLQVQETQAAIDGAVDAVNEALGGGIPTFEVNIATGHLLYTAQFVFSVSSPDGHLLWEVA